MPLQRSRKVQHETKSTILKLLDCRGKGGLKLMHQLVTYDRNKLESALPSKTLWQSVDIVDQTCQAGSFGFGIGMCAHYCPCS